jgi:hypothetical protein
VYVAGEFRLVLATMIHGYAVSQPVEFGDDRRADEVCASDYQNPHRAIVSITCLT